MKIPEPKYLFIPALAAGLVLTVATRSPPQRERAESRGDHLAQYCVPTEQAMDAHKIYC
jgi:hypothetical protein